MEEMEKSHNEFLHGAQEELKQEMATLQKKLLMDAVSSVWVFILCEVQNVYMYFFLCSLLLELHSKNTK